MKADITTAWLMAPDEPWTRSRVLLDLLGCSDDDPRVQAARADMLNHPRTKELIDVAAAWPGRVLKRHNDAKHPIYAISTLADFGLRTYPEIRDGLVKHSQENRTQLVWKQQICTAYGSQCALRRRETAQCLP